MKKLLNFCLFVSALSIANISLACGDRDDGGFCWDKYNSCNAKCMSKHGNDGYDYDLCENRCWLQYAPKDLRFLSKSQHIRRILNQAARTQ